MSEDNKMDLGAQLDALDQSEEKFVPIEEVRQLTNAVRAFFQGEFSGPDLELYGELGELARFINRMKSELREFQPNMIADEKIPEASDQLDAIVQQTEKATSRIMDALERVDNVHRDVLERLMCNEPPLDPDVMAGVEDSFTEAGTALTDVYEACNFQDLTGQRIMKIIKALREIERQVLRMVIVFGLKNEESELNESDKMRLEENVDLLEGPQTGNKGMDQDEIDDILSKLL